MQRFAHLEWALEVVELMAEQREQTSENTNPKRHRKHVLLQ